MLLLSNLSIKLNESRDYFLLSLFLAILILILSFLQGYSWLYILIFFILLIFPISKIYKIKKPHPNFLSLEFYQGHWVLYKINDEKITYEKIKIRVDAGFFMLVVLHGINKNRNLVIFYDQITKDERRRLYALEKIS